MKKMILVFVIFCAMKLSAGEPVHLDGAVPNYLNGLKSDNDGLVSSSIFHCVKLKLFYPDQEVGNIVRQLQRLSRLSENEPVRYKAWLAVQFLQNPIWLAGVEKKNYKDENQFFVVLSKALASSVLLTENR